MTLSVTHSSGQTVRYHANPQVSRFLQTDADHSWGVAAIIFKLHPNPSLNLIGFAIFHDSGEKWACDLSHPFKRAYPEIAKVHAEAEHELAKKHGIPQFELTDEEKLWIKLADGLESYLYCRLMCPWVLEAYGWKQQLVGHLRLAEQLGITQDILA
jgi:5'-deoxynucleotidase YfbR-like HD superfamily hydrolase